MLFSCYIDLSLLAFTFVKENKTQALSSDGLLFYNTGRESRVEVSSCHLVGDHGQCFPSHGPGASCIKVTWSCL